MRDYDERLSVPLWWWPVAAACVALLGAEVHAGFGLVGVVVTYAVLGALVAGVLAAYGGTHVRVRDGELRVSSARLPLSEVVEVRAVGPDEVRALHGPRADTRAYVFRRSYVPAAVYVGVRDPAPGRAPYWLVSSRRPGQLAAAVVQGIPAPGSGGGSARKGSKVDGEG